MSKLSIVMLIACAVSIPSAIAFGGGGSGGGNHNSDSKGTVNFFGSVFANSCKIEHGDKDKDVHLETVLNTKIKSDSPEQLKEFHITVRDCETHGNYVPKLAWGMNANLTSKGYLANTAHNGAENVALVLQDRNGANIDLNKSGNRFEPDSSPKGGSHDAISYSFKVGYIKDDDSRSTVTAGVVKAQADYSITYD